jgi:hypothetical protein
MVGGSGRSGGLVAAHLCEFLVVDLTMVSGRARLAVNDFTLGSSAKQCQAMARTRWSFSVKLAPLIVAIVFC